MSKKRKKRKLRLGRLLLLCIIIVVIGLGIYFVIPKNYGYKKDVVKVFKEENIIDIIRENKKYSKVLEEAILNNNFNKEYLLDYLNINYIEEDNYIDNINKLLVLGYNSNDINTFYEKLPNSINIIIDNEYDKDIVNYLNLSYFKEDYLDRYIKYGYAIKDLKSPYDVTNIINNFNYEDNVTFVNANLDKDYYTSDTLVSNEDAMKIDVLVNKYHKLDSKFEPSDLEKIDSKFASGNNQRMRKEAKEHFEEMCADALKDGYKMYAGSTYRSYDYQLGLYNRYVAKDGFNAAETYSARAGYSEHQLGLAVDILNHSWDYISEDNPEYTWLINNSYKYGFILRYPRGKEYITGYMFEDWHFRYLGIELANKVRESNLTYDEYVARGL